MLEIVMKKPFCLFLLFIIFSSPAFAFGTKKTMEKVMNSWSGEDINTAIEVLGYPTSEKEIANRHLFYWEESPRNSVVGVVTDTSGTTASSFPFISET